HPEGVPRQRGAPQLVSHARLVPDPGPDRRAIRGFPPEHVRRALTRAAARADRHLPRVSAPDREGRRRVALRDRRLPELALFAAAAILHTWPLASAPGTWGRVDN